MDEAEDLVHAQLEEQNMRINLDIIGELNMDIVMRPRLDVLTCDNLLPPILKGAEGTPVTWKEIQELFDEMFGDMLHGFPDMVLMMPVMHIITVFAKHDLWPAGFRLHCPLGYLSIQLLMMIFFGNSQSRADELSHERSIRVNGRD